MNARFFNLAINMKLIFSFAVAIVASPLAISAVDEQVVQEMARKTRIPPAEIRLNYDACDSGITLKMKICASYRWIIQDIRLNLVYKQTVAKAKESGYEASLIKAQRAWVLYRDSNCTFEGEMGAGGGTAEGLYILSCKEELTKQQANRLETVNLN
jgi:uncharacterized protein YecT (DUF1311 family)